MINFRLPRNMILTKDAEGRPKIIIIKSRMSTPLRCLEKQEVLTPAMVRYLKEYESRLSKDKDGKIKECKILGRIRTILLKPKLDVDPIRSKINELNKKYSQCRYTEAHYRRAGFKGYDDWKLQDDKRLVELEKAKKEYEEKQLKEKKNADAKKK